MWTFSSVCLWEVSMLMGFCLWVICSMYSFGIFCVKVILCMCRSCIDTSVSVIESIVWYIGVCVYMNMFSIIVCVLGVCVYVCV